MMVRCASLIALAVLPATFLLKFLRVFVIFFAVWLPAHGADPVSRNWQSGIPADNVLAYEVFRNDTRIGFHHMQFSRKDGEVRVDIHIELDVSLGFIPLFSYTHDNTEIWRDGVLQSLVSKTDNNGDLAFADLALKENSYLGTGSRYDGGLGLPIMPTSYFDPNFVRQQRLISSQDGRLLEVSVAYLGPEQVPDINGSVEAHRFRLTGDLEIDIWYTGDGRWVRTEFSRGGVLSYRPGAASAIPPKTAWRKVEVEE